MDMEYKILPIKIYTKVTTYMESQVDMESISGRMEFLTREISGKACVKDKESGLINLPISIKVHSKATEKMVMENILGQTETSTKVNGGMENKLLKVIFYFNSDLYCPEK